MLAPLNSLKKTAERI